MIELAIDNNVKLLTQEQKLAAFQASQKSKRASEKKSSAKPMVEESNVQYLYDATTETSELHLFSIQLGLTIGDDCVSFWKQKDTRQTCWMAAVDAINAASRKKLPMLLACAKDITEKTNSPDFILNNVERLYMGSIVTTGRFSLRMQFWKFITYKGLNHFVPVDLTTIVSIKMAVIHEIEKADKAEVETWSAKIRAEANEIFMAGEYIDQSYDRILHIVSRAKTLFSCEVNCVKQYNPDTSTRVDRKELFRYAIENLSVDEAAKVLQTMLVEYDKRPDRARNPSIEEIVGDHRVYITTSIIRIYKL